MYQPLPIGVDDFEKIITKGYYYVDKTLMIKDLLDRKGEASLFTRPRRLGKSLSILYLQKYYFSMVWQEAGKLPDVAALYGNRGGGHKDDGAGNIRVPGGNNQLL